MAGEKSSVFGLVASAFETSVLLLMKMMSSLEDLSDAVGKAQT